MSTLDKIQQVLNGNKLQVYKKKIIHVYLSNLKTEHYNIGTTL